MTYTKGYKVYKTELAYPQREFHRPVIGLEAHWAALLQYGLVGSVQTFSHHRNGIVTGLLVDVVGWLVGIVLIVFLVSQQVRVQVSKRCGTKLIEIIIMTSRFKKFKKGDGTM